MADVSVTTVDTGPRTVTRQVLVHAPVGNLFALIANPHRHPELDGSGTVRDVPVTGPRRLALGDRFTVRMKQFGFPYKITSTVTAFEDDHVIEWRHPLGHRWRWELTEVEPGVTRIAETFDYGGARSPAMLELFGYPRKNGEGIANTLRALAARYA
jgi:Polyketide cyclase / dehydrase and lipid transport